MSEHNEQLPSGRWMGFYVYPHARDRHRMDLRLEITPARITGTGIDDVGRFVLSGRVHEDGKVNWVKTYPGRHDVLYEGYADHNGIWGTWEIPPYTNGGFQIWPEAWGEGVVRELAVAEPIEFEDLVGVKV